MSEEVRAARRAGLVYTRNDDEGIRREVRQGKFIYFLRDKQIDDPEEVRRINRLVLPPAWTDVWICPNPAGHLQATGRDARGRKQYRYHPEWDEHRRVARFEHLADFGRALPRLRRRVDKDLRHRGLDRERVLAAALAILDEASPRVGNEQYVAENKSYGLTTLRKRHAQIRGGSIRFRYRAKSGKEQDVRIDNRRLARVLQQCGDLPGQHLFSYQTPDGETRPIRSEDVNAYIHEVMGEGFTAKDFRAWRGTLEAFCYLASMPDRGPASQRAAIQAAAARLGNTCAVCRKRYIHPRLIAKEVAEEPWETFRIQGNATRQQKEKLLIRFLERRARKAGRKESGGKNTATRNANAA